MEKWKQSLSFLLDRLCEPSTWQGVGFLVALTGSKVGLGLDWGQCAGIGGCVSAFIKMVMPDGWKYQAK